MLFKLIDLFKNVLRIKRPCISISIEQLNNFLVKTSAVFSRLSFDEFEGIFSDSLNRYIWHRIDEFEI